MHPYKTFGLAVLLVGGLSVGTAQAQSGGGCSGVTIDSVSRSTFAQSYKYKNSASNVSNGTWTITTSVSDPAAIFNGATAKQTSSIFDSAISVDVEAHASSRVSDSYAASICVVEFTVEHSLWEVGEWAIDTFAPIEMELDLHLKASSYQGSGTPDQAWVYLFDSSGGLIFQDDIEGTSTSGDSANVATNLDLWPDTYTLMVVAEASSEPGKVRLKRKSWSESWSAFVIPSRNTYQTLANVDVRFTETVAPGTAMVELVSQERGVSATTTSSSDSDSDTNACYTNLSASTTGGVIARANQESEMRSSAFWGALEAYTSCPFLGNAAAAQSHMQAEFDVTSTTDVSIDMYVYFDIAWSSVNARSSGGITGSIVNLDTGMVEWSYSQIISVPTSFDDWPSDSLTLAPGRYELVLSLSSDARWENSSGWTPTALVYLSPMIRFD